MACEADEITVSKSRYSGNFYQLLASIGIYPNKTYNFYEEVKKWYLNNTNLTPEEIEFTLNAKIEHAAKDKNAFFPKFIKSVKTKRVRLLGPEKWHEELIKAGYDSELLKDADANARAIYIYDDGVMLFNPFLEGDSPESLLKTIIHELLHSIQDIAGKREKVVKVLPYYNPSTKKKINPTEHDPSIKHHSAFDAYTYRGYSPPAEVDTLLGEVNRVIALLKGVMIYPNDNASAEKALRYVIDPRNESELPELFKDSIIILRGIITGETKDSPNSPQEQDRIIKLFAQRLSLLAKNTNNNTIKRTV